MTDTIQVIPVLGPDGEPVVENGQILVQNQDDNLLMYVDADYFEESSTTITADGSQDNLILENDEDGLQEETKNDEIIEQTEEVIVKPAKLTWPRKAMKLLLQFYGTNRELVLNGKLKNYKAMWMKISDEMNKYGFKINPSQAENKLKTLQKSYKDRLHSNKINTRSKHIDLDEELEALFSKEHISPPVVSGTKGVRVQAVYTEDVQQIPQSESSSDIQVIEEDENSARLQQDMSSPVDENDEIDENTIYVEVHDLTNDESADLCDELDSGIDQSSSENKRSRKRKRQTATRRALQETLDVYRGSSKRTELFLTEISELYKKEVKDAQQFRQESLKFKSRQLQLLEKLLELKSKSS